MVSKTLSQVEPYRPKMHLTPVKGWLNDPNGLVFFNGCYHQFYQYFPNDVVWGPMHWGHQSSGNLIDWEEHDIALFPDEFGMCFSGSAVVDKNNTSGLFPSGSGLVALYTSFVECRYQTVSAEVDVRPEQHQSLAYSEDGIEWIKYKNGAPILKSRGNPDFRDPKVFWHATSRAWVMVLACGQHIEIYRSSNLIDWQLVSEFGHRYGIHSKGPWECPDLFELTCPHTNRCYWILIVGIGEGAWAGGSGTQYFVGFFDGYTFTSIYRHNSVMWLDFGRDHYATQSFSDAPDGERIISAWMSNHQYAKVLPTDTFRGAMIVPRQLNLNAQNPEYPFLMQSFVSSVHDFFESQSLWQPTFDKGEFAVKETEWSCLLIEFDIEMRDGESIEIEPYACKTLQYKLYFSDGQLTVRTWRQNNWNEDLRANGFNHDYEVKHSCNGRVSVQLLLDEGHTTLLINDSIAYTHLSFPLSTEVKLAVLASARLAPLPILLHY